MIEHSSGRDNLRCRVLCEHCDGVIEARVPRVGEDMNRDALAAFGKAILAARLVHAIMECKALIAS